MNQNNENSTYIFVITHKKINLQLPPHYQALFVGASKLLEGDRKNYSNYLFDDNGINISVKNSNYCELTGLYWIWKNIKCDIVGISHYRRYFSTSRFSDRFIKTERVSKILKNKDIILPKKVYLSKSIKSHYSKYHSKMDLEILRNIIETDFPEYLEPFELAFSKYFLFPYNMMICYKELFDEYCSWLFNLINKLESYVEISHYDDYQKRIFGFISERLLLVWLLKNKYKIKEYPVNEIHKCKKDKIIEQFKIYQAVINNILKKHKIKEMLYL